MACNLCAPGFYGDAIKLKDCQSCICDELGTEHCDNYIGTCHCHDNVIGDKCDRCEQDHYGFDSGLGCRSCDCAVASNSTQCDDHTGDCRCSPGVTGRQCDRCLPGYFNYTGAGCTPCSCNTDYSRGLGCNSNTGQCECLPGVIGEKCDACPHRWVLIPDTGCHTCDICHHALLDVTDKMRIDLDPVVEEFETIAGGYFTAQKLVYLNETVDKMEPDVKALDPHGVNLTPLRNQIESLEQDIKNVDRRVLYAKQRANDLAVGGHKLVNETENVLDVGRLTHTNVQNTIGEVEKLADSFDETAESTKLESGTEEAEQLLTNLLGYSLPNSTKQLDDTITYLNTIMQFSNPVLEQNERLDTLRSKIGLFSDKMEDLLGWSMAARAKSSEAEQLYDKYKDAPLNSKFDTVQSQSDEAIKNIASTDVLGIKGNVTMGEIYLNVNRLENVNNILKDMEHEVDALLPTNADEVSKLAGTIEEVEAHQNDLVTSARNLKNQLSNITANSETPLKAANAYKDIVEAVNNARSAIKDAKQSAGNATELCDGIGDRAGTSDQVARKMLDDARTALTNVQADLQPHLNRSSATVQEIIDSHKGSDAETDVINKALDQINIESPTDLWQNARDQAIDAQEQVQETQQIYRPIVKSLSDELERAKQMPKEVDDTNKDIDQASGQVDRVATLFPRLKELADELDAKQDDTAKIGSLLGRRIEDLKQQIENARELANSIKVGVTFQPSTALELPAPANLPQQSQSTRVSAFVKTDKPNGFIMYLGKENNTQQQQQVPRRQKRVGSDSFMALEIENGYPILTVDFGTGTQKIISNKNVANDQWHQVIVERDGNNVKLIVREEIADGKDQLHEVSERLPGNETLLNMDPENTKLFVGGYPPEYNMPDGLKYSSFEGQIEDLRIGDQEVGLWNFVDAQDNNNGAVERDRLVASELPATGYRFSGQGYVILDSKPYHFRTRSSIQFRFKVSNDVSNGLIFYAGKNRHFISVEMRDGGIYFQYKLGAHLVTIATKMQLNDDQWHRVEAERQGRKGILKVDNQMIYQQETPEGSEENLRIADNMYFGGYPGKLNHTEIVTKNFDGCIDDIYIDGTPVDLSRNLKAYNVRPGCPPKFSKMLTYGPRQFGYLQRGNITANNHFQVNLKFRTKQREGLIFYASSHDQESTIGLSLQNGALVLNSQKLQLSSAPHVFNDGDWHVVTVTHDAKKLRMSVPEMDEFVSDFNTEQLQIENGDIYFGGLPKGFKTPRGVLASNAYLVGCISDVTIGGHMVNFANSTDRKNAVLDNCHRDVFDYDVDTLRIVYPEDNLEAEERLNMIEESTHHEEKERQKQAVQKQREQKDKEERQRLEDEQRQRNEEEERERKEKEEERKNFDRLNELSGGGEGDGGTDDEGGEELPLFTTAPPTQPTTLRPTRRRPAADNRTEPICHLPVEPELDVDFDAGYRFGTSSDSRVEFTSIPSKIKKSYDIALQFRTSHPDGVLFYASDSRHTDFIGLYLKDGKVYHSFNCGSGLANISSMGRYDDNQWHSVTFTRQQSKGTLHIDSDDKQVGESDGTARTMNVQAPYFFGGVASTAIEDSNINLKLSKDNQFQGCIRSIQMAARSLGTPTEQVGVLPCSDQVESGVFFGKGGGFVKLRDRFKVGAELTIEMEIKPRTLDALLLSVHGKNAYLILQLINGTINFTVDNGAGPIVATYKPEEGQNFCDGNWHKVMAVKSNYVITLIVNQITSQPTIGDTRIISTDTTRPLFVGGHPHLSKARGLTVRRPYMGCMRNVKIRSVAEDIKAGMTVGNVQTGSCPTN